MGTSNSKKSGDIAIFTANSKNKKTGDIMNESLLQFCISNSSDDIISALDSGIDLASPYKGVPLIFSAVLALLNDENFDRFKANWEVLVNNKNCPTHIPIISTINVGLTNFTRDNVRLRDSCYPVIHINALTKDLVDTEFRCHHTVLMCKPKDADLKKVLVSVMATVGRALKFVTDRNEHVDCVYKGTPTERFEITIRRNAKYLVDNINALDNSWDRMMQPRVYAEKYKDDYSVDNIITAEVVDVESQGEPLKK